MTFRQLVIRYDAIVVSQWDHTAMIASQVYNVGVIVMWALSKHSKAKPKTPTDFNPLRKKKPKGMKVGGANITDLKMFCMVRK